MKSIVTFQKIVSYTSIAVFVLITVIFFSSYASLKKARITKWRLKWCAEFLAFEKVETNEYPYNMRCYVDRGYRFIDGNGNPLHYECIDDGKDYVLFSVGDDGIPYTEDDIYAEKHTLTEYDYYYWYN